LKGDGCFSPAYQALHKKQISPERHGCATHISAIRGKGWFLCKVGGISKVTRLYRLGCGILMCMKTKNMRELEKMWAKKASEQSNPQKKAGTPTRQAPTRTTVAARKSSRGR
jgi:hypothetical protein